MKPAEYFFVKIREIIPKFEKVENKISQKVNFYT